MLARQRKEMDSLIFYNPAHAQRTLGSVLYNLFNIKLSLTVNASDYQKKLY